MIAPASASSRHKALLAASYLLSAGCLYWTLRDAHLSEFKDDLADVNWLWLALAVVADTATYFWQAVRWRIILRPVEDVPYHRVLRAIYVGLFVNETFPLRAGEVLRCYILTARSRLPFSVFLSSAFIERVFDGIWLCVFVMIAAHQIPSQGKLKYIGEGAYVLGVVVLVATAVLAFAMTRARRPQAESENKGWRRQFDILIDSLSQIGHSRHLYIALLHTLPFMLIQAVPIWGTINGYGFDLTFASAFTMLVILRLGTVIPQAPGNLGIFQFLIKEVLERIYHVAPDEASRFSLLLWGVVTLPLMLGGAIAVAITGSHINELRRLAASEAAEMKNS